MRFFLISFKQLLSFSSTCVAVDTVMTSSLPVSPVTDIGHRSWGDGSRLTSVFPCQGGHSCHATDAASSPCLPSIRYPVLTASQKSQTSFCFPKGQRRHQNPVLTPGPEASHSFAKSPSRALGSRTCSEAQSSSLQAHGL